MDKLKYTPWFDTRKGELPVRPGIYEGRSFVAPERGPFVLSPSCYHWDGLRWVDSRRSPHPIRWADSTVRYWRGVIPGEDYPFDQVEMPPSLYSGVLERAATVDKLTIQRLAIKGDEMSIAFARERGNREPENYRTILHKTGDSFTGESQIRIGDFTTEKAAQLRVPAFVEVEGGLNLTLILQGVTSDWHSFDGVLSRAL